MVMRILLLLPLLGCTGCDLREVAEETEIPLESNTGVKTLPHHLRAEVEPLEMPSRYRVVVEWRAGERSLALSRRQPQTTFEKLATLGPTVGRYVDDTVVAGENYSYALSSINDKGEAENVLSEVQVSIPRDLLIDRAITRTEISNFRRLFLTSTGKIQGNGNLKIEVSEIHSDGGRIENLSDGSGLLLVTAERAWGKLTVATSGKNGACGRPGAKGIPGKKGGDGRPGTISPKNLTPRLAIQYFEWLAEQKKTVHDISEEDLKTGFVCQSAPTDGEAGGNGGPGGDGGAGEKGGDSGKLWIEIRHASELTLSTTVEPGNGGPGGAAGEGGVGGTGGDAGKDFFVCPKAKRGKAGENGEPGKSGNSGGRGLSLTPCLHLGATRVGDCDSSPRL